MVDTAPLRLAVDVMGGDYAPEVVLDGIDAALASDENLTLLACGLPEVVEPFAASRPRVEALCATEVIAMDEHPAQAVRGKRDASLVVGCKAVASGEAAGFFSAGSTGAVLSAATLKIGRIKGVKRPALGQVLPAYGRPTLLIDVGANAECKPEYLRQFAIMGQAYMKALYGLEAPTCGLLNNGAEETKGTPLMQEAYRLMADSVPGFMGNVEGHDVVSGLVDVIVVDGFSGNLVLKTIEGTASVLFRYVKDVFKASLKNTLAAAVVKGDLGQLKAKLSPETYGGSPLLGVQGACIVGHGSSNATAIANGIAVCAKTARGNVASAIAQAVSGIDG